jgi:hypothetical protein
LQAGPALDMNRPGNMYASMLSPLIGLPVKGAIWHQGYNESSQPNGHKLYARVSPEMIKSNDGGGLPFDTQRNDTWSLADIYEIYIGKKTKTPGVPENKELIQPLEAADRKRRIEDAKARLKAASINVESR